MLQHSKLGTALAQPYAFMPSVTMKRELII